MDFMATYVIDFEKILTLTKSDFKKKFDVSFHERTKKKSEPIEKTYSF